MSAIPFIPFNNTIKLEPVFIWQDQRVQNVHYYIVDETPNVDTARALALSYIDWFDTTAKESVSNTASLVLVKATIMETETSPGVEVSTGLPIVGTRAANPLPNNVTLAVKWTTGLRGRSYRGRTYIIGLTEGDVDGNTVPAASITAYMAIYGELLALDTDVGPGVMGIASRVSNGTPRTVGVITPVTDLEINPVVDSQRRRLPGRGR